MTYCIYCGVPSTSSEDLHKPTISLKVQYCYLCGKILKEHEDKKPCKVGKV